MNVLRATRRIAAAAALSGLALIASVGLGVGTGVAAAAPSVTSLVYEVVIEGTASGNAFRRTATLTLIPTVTDVTGNGVNPFEACLRSGFPAGAPAVGAIWYGTNTACFPDRGQAIDLTYAVADADGFHTEADPNLQALMVNHWTASDDYIFAFPYGPVSGGTTYRFFEDGTVQGAVELVGHGGLGGYSTYSATFSGALVG